MVPRLGRVVLSVAGTAGRSPFAFPPPVRVLGGAVHRRRRGRGEREKTVSETVGGTPGGMNAPDLLTGRSPASSAAPQVLEEGIRKGI